MRNFGLQFTERYVRAVGERLDPPADNDLFSPVGETGRSEPCPYSFFEKLGKLKLKGSIFEVSNYGR